MIYRLGQFVRHDRRVWVSVCGVVITDTAMINVLEAEYRAAQREQTVQPRPARHNGRYTPPALKPGRVMTPREKRQNGRAE